MTETRIRALNALIRLRKTEVEQARNALAAALAEEQNAIAYTEAQKTRMKTEQEAVKTGQVDLSDFCLWFPVGQDAIEHAQKQQAIAEASTEQTRAALMNAHGALKAAETLLETRLKEEKERREHREMAEIDDLSRRLKSSKFL